VVRVPAIPRFYEGIYPLPVKVPGFLLSRLYDFRPQIVHAHHPFLLGNAARTWSAIWGIPLVYTHHSLFTRYLDIKQGRFTENVQQLVTDLTAAYCRECAAVIAPSRSVAELLKSRVDPTLVEVVPTGVDTSRFSGGDGHQFRRSRDIPRDAYLIGHVGRLSYQKNLQYLARAVAAHLHDAPAAHFAVAGEGDELDVMLQIFRDRGVDRRVHACGVLEGMQLVDAYAAFDVFAFSSRSETQGMVLTEALALGTPVVALDASGVRDIVRDGVNGRLLHDATESEFAAALHWPAGLSAARREQVRANALAAADAMSLERSCDAILRLYKSVAAKRRPTKRAFLTTVERALGSQWRQWSELAHAVGKAASV